MNIERTKNREHRKNKEQRTKKEKRANIWCAEKKKRYKEKDRISGETKETKNTARKGGNICRKKISRDSTWVDNVNLAHYPLYKVEK